MKKIDLKDKLRRGELTIGSWITMDNEMVVEIMSSLDFDWLAVDMEHSAIDLAGTQNIVRIIDLNGGVALVRVGENNPALIKRVMDTGAHGVIVPMVNSREDAQKAVNAVKYPPVGTRGVGLARAQGYGTEFERYKNWVNKGSIVIIQIEHIEAVRNMEEILSVPGIDGFIVGPYDLSGSLGKPGQFNDPEVKDALKRVMKVAKQFKMTPGFHVIPADVNEVNKKIKEGFRFISFSIDMIIFKRACQSLLAQVKGRGKK